MSAINKDGMLVDGKVILRRFPTIEHGKLAGVQAIVVHQTDAPTAQHTFNSYTAGGNGAHFLIDKNGLIYQTASMNMRCYHVGRLIKSKCLTVNKNSCGSTIWRSRLVVWHTLGKRAFVRTREFESRLLRQIVLFAKS